MKLMKKNPLLIAILTVSMVLPQIAIAQDYNPDPGGEDTSLLSLPPVPPLAKNETDVGEAISPMKKGQTAPFTGLLLSPKAIASIIADIQSRNEEIQIEIQRVIETAEIQHSYEMTVERIRNESDNKLSLNRIQEQRKEIDRLDAALKKEKEDRPNPIVWAAVGVGAGVLVSTLTAAAVVYAVKQ